MNIHSKSLKEIVTHKYFRFDGKYWHTHDTYNYSKYVFLKDLFQIVNGSVQTENYTTDKTNIPYVRIGDIDYKYGISLENTIYLDNDSEIAEERILKEDDIILATIGATAGKVGIASCAVGGTHSNNTVVLRPLDASVNTRYYEKLFQTDWFINYLFGLVAQKAQPNLQPYEIENIKIPVVSQSNMDKALAQVAPIETEIKLRKEKLFSVKESIDSVFQREFGLDIEEYWNIDARTKVSVAQGILSENNCNLRCSYRWNKAAEFQNHTSKHVDCASLLGRHIISTQNGWSPICDENESGYQVLGIDAISTNGTLSFDNPKFSSEYKKDFFKYCVHDGDFFVSRGNTVDLVAMAAVAHITEEETPHTVYPDLMIKVEFDGEIDKQYMAYVFNSFIGRYYFKYSTKGKNQTMVKVSPQELSDFIVPLPDIHTQQRIVEEIQAEIKNQDDIKAEIADLRSQIDDIIIRTISA